MLLVNIFNCLPSNVIILFYCKILLCYSSVIDCEFNIMVNKTIAKF